MPQSKRLQDVIAIGGMRAHAKLAFDHVRSPLRRPHLLSVPKRFCSLRQQVRQLLGTQLGLRTWCWGPTQSTYPLSLRSAQPLTHGTFAHSQDRNSLFLLPPLLRQFPRTQKTTFFPIVWFVFLLHPSSFTGFANHSVVSSP
jgi:hypothetical protein